MGTVENPQSANPSNSSNSVTSHYEILFMKFGSVCRRVGMHLIKNYGDTLDGIENTTQITLIDIKCAVAILIQHNIIESTLHKGKLRYFLNTVELERVLYYPLYLNYIEDTVVECKPFFKKLMVAGILNVKKDDKYTKELLERKIITHFYNKSILEAELTIEGVTKKPKGSAVYYKVDYTTLDRLLSIAIVKEHLSKLFGPGMGAVFEIIAHAELYDKYGTAEQIKKALYEKLNLDLWTDSNKCENWEAVDGYCQYLQSIGLLNDNPKLIYKDIAMIQNVHVECFLGDIAQKRLFYMILDKKMLTDKEITVCSLLPIIYQKNSIFTLQANGLIYERCTQSYKTHQKPDTEYIVDRGFYRKNILKRIEEELLKRQTEALEASKLIKLHFIFTREDK